MQEKIFKRENERLYLDERQLATSKHLVKNMGYNLPMQRPDLNQHDLRLIKDDDSRVDAEVRNLEVIAQISAQMSATK